MSAAVLSFAVVACLAQSPQIGEWTHLPDRWRAHLVSPGGDLEFGLSLPVDSTGKTKAWIANAQERIQVPVVEWSRERLELVLEFPHYDSRITASASTDGSVLSGLWRKRKGAEQWTEMRFEARVRTPAQGWPSFDDVGGESRLRDAIFNPGRSKHSFFGTWKATFGSQSAPSVARFDEWSWMGLDEWSWLERTDDYQSEFVSTFLTTLGDYRYLSGGYDRDSDRVTLSCFDGAHAFLFKAKMLEDGSLEGEFWSGDSWHDTWTAVRDANAALPDPFGLTKTVEGVQLDELSFPDVDGVARKLGDERFAGKARLVQLFGTWCPNCNDETRYLRELDQRYRERGLSIVGLAFELTGDFERDAGQVRKYAAHHDIAYPLLVAGVSDKKKASERFPLLDKVRAYPTTLFVDASGRVRAVHQGFSGPATGREHHKLREDFERLIETMLAEER